MNEEISPPNPAAPPDSSHKDRRAWLIVFGIFQILLGLLCLGMAALIPLSQTLATTGGAEPMPLRMLIPGLLMYVGWGVMFLWLGIGSALCRRWARALTLILSWIWLIVGLCIVPMMAWLMPRIMQSAAATEQQIPGGMMQVIIVTQIIFMTVIFIVIPAMLVLFYRGRNVKATCETRDPVRRWTDKCPLPLLAITCMMFFGALCMLSVSLANMAVLPLFGTLLSGLPAAALMIALACFMLWIGWSFYRVKIAGWWALLGMMIVFGISNVLTFSRVDVMEIYKKLDYPQSQMDLLDQQNWLTSDYMIWSSILWFLPMLVFALWIKRFFRTSEEAT